MNFSTKRLVNKVKQSLSIYGQQHREWSIARQVDAHAVQLEDQPPIVLFNSSTRLVGMSYNSAYQQLTAWALRLKGVPVIHFVCNAGMSHCVQGTNRENPFQRPSCQGCLTQSRALYEGASISWFSFEPDPELTSQLEGLSLDDLIAFSFHDLPLGKLVLPSLRWVLRRYHLIDDQPTRYLCCQYILSAWNIAQKFSALIEKYHPQTLVVFNGIFFPEAVATWIAKKADFQVVSHETGFMPFTGFFTWGNATAYPLDPPRDFNLSPLQEARLDAYLGHRFKGDFSVAGIRFWPEIKNLDESLLKKMEGFDQVIPVFTNVIFDTSQEYANGIFKDMFDWLEQLQAFIRTHPEILFIIRAHPDEGRKGKASRETVADWIHSTGVESLPNVVFINSNDYISSYELIQRSNLILVYNSSIGLEASILGKNVLCAGKVRYHTQGCQTVFLPESISNYFKFLEDNLTGNEIEFADSLRNNARRFLYYQIFLASLPFDRFLRAEGNPGFVGFSQFSWEELLPRHSIPLTVIVDGILNGKSFILPDDLPV